MSKILFSAFSNVWIGDLWDAHAEGFICALERGGNEVLCVRTNRFVRQQISSQLKEEIDTAKVVEKVRAFQPDLIITYNHSLPGLELLEATFCPVVIYPADVPAFWCDIPYISEHLDRYYFCQTAVQIESAVRVLFPSVKEQQFIPFGYVTDLHAIEIAQDIPVSFVGSIGNYAGDFVKYFQQLDQERLSSREKNQKKDAFFTSFDAFQKDTMQPLRFSFDPVSPVTAAEAKGILCLTCRERMQILSGMTDLGLKIYGWADSWAKVLEYDHALFRCYDYCPSVTLSDNTKTYNRSKISLNLPHGNSVDGFSWRVCDILASNSVLLSVRKPDLDRLMSPYIRNFPMFESPAEARTLVKNLLADPIWRKELTAVSQLMVEENCRFEPRLKTMETAIPSLHLIGGKGGNTAYLSHSQCLKLNADTLLMQLKQSRFLKKIARKVIPYELYLSIYKKNHPGYS